MRKVVGTEGHAGKGPTRDVPTEHLVDNTRVTDEWHHDHQLLVHGAEDLVRLANRERSSEPALKSCLELRPELKEILVVAGWTVNVVQVPRSGSDGTVDAQLQTLR